MPRADLTSSRKGQLLLPVLPWEFHAQQRMRFVDQQIAFAAAHGIPKAELEATAALFANWSGQPVALAA